MYKLLEEEANIELMQNQRLLESAGVTTNEAEFGIRFSSGTYEVSVLVFRTNWYRTWLYNWDEAHKFIMSTFPDKNWEETGWRH
jgi:hypothetical protein